jgi:hypothetical protein
MVLSTKVPNVKVVLQFGQLLFINRNIYSSANIISVNFADLCILKQCSLTNVYQSFGETY